MVKYWLKSSQSSEVAVTTVNYPNPVILEVSPPGSPQPAGSVLGVYAKIRNDGGPGYITLWVKDADTGAILGSFTTDFLSGERGIIGASFIMPNRDVRIRVEAGYDNTVTSSWPTTYLIELFVEIATSLTFNITPTTVRIGGTVSFSGKLTRADTGAGVGGVMIKVIDRSGSLIATATTMSDGSYSGSFNAPLTPSTYYYSAVFEGAWIAGLYLSPSTATAILTTTAVSLRDYAPLLLPIIFGSTMIVWRVVRR